MYELINNVIIEIMATMAQAELEKIKKRQREGIDVAMANGVKFGRRKIEVDEKFIVHYDEWKAKKITAVEAMKRTGLKRSTFYNLVKEYEKKGAVTKCTFLHFRYSPFYIQKLPRFLR